MTAVGLGIFWRSWRSPGRDARRAWRRSWPASPSPAGSRWSLLAYPLYVQFLGPQSYHGLSRDVRRYGADLASYVAFSRQSLAGDRGDRGRTGAEPDRGERVLRLAAGRPRWSPWSSGCGRRA